MHEKLRPGEKGFCVGKPWIIFQWFPSKFFHSGYSRILWNSEWLGHTPSRHRRVSNGFVFQHLPVFCLFIFILLLLLLLRMVILCVFCCCCPIFLFFLFLIENNVHTFKQSQRTRVVLPEEGWQPAFSPGHQVWMSLWAVPMLEGHLLTPREQMSTSRKGPYSFSCCLSQRSLTQSMRTTYMIFISLLSFGKSFD